MACRPLRWSLPWRLELRPWLSIVPWRLELWLLLDRLDPRRWSRRALAARIAAGLAALAAADVGYQVARKPTELLGLVARGGPKAPAGTWRAYRGLFEESSTPNVRPELLAALVQVESSGDPLARTRWRLRWTASPLDLYAPASSAVGLLQMTDGTYQRARHLCIRDHGVVRDGPWWDPRTCFLNALYLRTVPGHAIEMTAAYLHVTSAAILARPRMRQPSDAERDALVAAIHLCGPERAASFAARGFRPRRGERCGDHDLRAYLARVRDLVAVFDAVRATGE